MTQVIKAVLLLLFTPLAVFADGGVLIPRDKAQPDPSILSLEEMEITVQIDNGDARVFVQQIFANHTGEIEEGNYIFALPSRATVSDFAVWDGPTRIPAVVLEAKRGSVFSARIVPISPYGTKRLEFEYHQAIPVESLKSYFAIPLRPDAYQAQVAHHLKINFEWKSAHALTNFQSPAKAYALRLDQNTPHLVKGSFQGENINLTEDFVATLDLDKSGSDTVAVIAHRQPVSGQPSPAEMAPVRSTNEPGFFAANALLGFGQKNVQGSAISKTDNAKTLVVLLDTSLSMQWEKLERSYQALETLLRTLQPQDRFNLILFNSQIQVFQPTPVVADSTAVQHALEFVRASRLRGGTDLQKALQEGLRESAAGGSNPYIVLLSDGGSTEGVIRNAKLASWYDAQWKSLPATGRPKTYIFGVGDDANLPLFKLLARQDGVLENVLSTEPIDFKLNSFLSKIGRRPI